MCNNNQEIHYYVLFFLFLLNTQEIKHIIQMMSCVCRSLYYNPMSLQPLEPIILLEIYSIFTGNGNKCIIYLCSCLLLSWTFFFKVQQRQEQTENYVAVWILVKVILLKYFITVVELTFAGCTVVRILSHAQIHENATRIRTQNNCNPPKNIPSCYFFVVRLSPITNTW